MWPAGYCAKRTSQPYRVKDLGLPTTSEFPTQLPRLNWIEAWSGCGVSLQLCRSEFLQTLTSSPQGSQGYTEDFQVRRPFRGERPFLSNGKLVSIADAAGI